MAWIEKKQRRDGTVSARVVWRLGGPREGPYQSETFGAGSDAQNLARADGFKKMVDAAGQRWPDGWVRGEGFVRPRGEADPLKAPPPFVDIGEEYVRQIVDLSPGQRKRYLGHLKVLAETQVRGSLVFTKPVTAVTEADLKDWLIGWERSLKTKANYHGLIHGVFAFAVKRGYLASNPAVGNAPKPSRVKQSRPELCFLTERELVTAVRLAGAHSDVLTVAVGTGLRFGELRALWVGDVDLDHRTIRVNKAWKRNGENDTTDTPGWLAKQLRPKHRMRDHHLGNPKTAKSRRTITISPSVAQVLARRIEGKSADDFVFATRTGLPLHNGDFYTHVWRKLIKALAEEGIAPFRFHDLRHTHVAWLIAGGAPCRTSRPGSATSPSPPRSTPTATCCPPATSSSLRSSTRRSLAARSDRGPIYDRVAFSDRVQHTGGAAMIFDRIEWDEHNLDHATRRLTVAEIEQAIWNAPRMRANPRNPGRARIDSVTDGGKAVVIIVALMPNGVRPITGWEA